MDTVLLDTDVFSYLMRAGDPHAERFRPLLVHANPAVSFVTVGEIYVSGV